MGTQFVALLVGAVLVLGVREARRWWQAKREADAAVAAGDHEGAGEEQALADSGGGAGGPAPAAPAVPVEPVEPDWQRLLIALRPIRDRGWEGPIGQPAEESWPMVLLMVFCGLMLGLAFVAGPWSWAVFVLYFLLGIAAALTALGLSDWQARVMLPPGGRGTLIRGAAACITTLGILLWAPHTSHQGLTVRSIRTELLAVSITKRPRQLADQFHGPGLALSGTMVLAVLVGASLLIMTIVEVSSTRAITAVGRGSRRRSTLWWAQFYRDRQPPLWGRYVVLTVLGFSLSAGVLLRLWSSTLGKP